MQNVPTGSIAKKHPVMTQAHAPSDQDTVPWSTNPYVGVMAELIATLAWQPCTDKTLPTTAHAKKRSQTTELALQ